MRFISSLSVSSMMLVACLAATACSSGSGSGDPGADGGGDSGGVDPIVGKSCNTDGDCGSAYTCEGAKPVEFVVTS